FSLLHARSAARQNLGAARGVPGEYVNPQVAAESKGFGPFARQGRYRSRRQYGRQHVVRASDLKCFLPAILSKRPKSPRPKVHLRYFKPPFHKSQQNILLA